MNRNIGYVHEIAAKVIIADRHNESASALIKAGRGNGITDAQLEEAGATLLGLPDSSDDGILDYVHRLYVTDGLKKGYVSARGDAGSHTLWVLGQLAHDHYGE